MGNEPLRVIEGNTLPHEAFWNIKDTKDGIEIEFDGPISEYSWWGDEITPKLFKDELYEKGQGKPVTVLINSPGGEVVAASVIRSILQEYPGKVTADIVGWAASAATIVMTGADHIRMRESALMMIHDPSTVVWGTIAEIQQALGVLDTVKSGIIDTYQTKTGMPREELAQMMSSETWLTAREAFEMGFIDEVVIGSIKKAPVGNLRAGFLNCLRDIPAEFTAQLEVEPELKPIESEVVEDPEVTKFRNYVYLFGRKTV